MLHFTIYFLLIEVYLIPVLILFVAIYFSLYASARCYYNLLQYMQHKNNRCLYIYNFSNDKGGSPRGNDSGGNNAVSGPNGGKTGKNSRGRGRASGASPRGRSPYIDSDILGGRTPAS